MPVVEKMIGMLKGLYMKLRAQVIPATEVGGKETAGQSAVHRRIEIIVQRETVSIVVPGLSADEAGRTARGESGPEAQCQDSLLKSIRLPSVKAPSS